MESRILTSGSSNTITSGAFRTLDGGICDYEEMEQTNRNLFKYGIAENVKYKITIQSYTTSTLELFMHSNTFPNTFFSFIIVMASFTSSNGYVLYTCVCNLDDLYIEHKCSTHYDINSILYVFMYVCIHSCIPTS